MTQRRLTRREVAKIDKIAEALANLRAYYCEDEDEPNGKDVLLQITENGSVYGCISCALAALDTILQEYSADFTQDR